VFSIDYGCIQMTSAAVGILDCGSGNLRSVSKALDRLGSRPTISAEVDPDWDGLILPGVGAFGHAMEHLGDPAPILDFVSSGKPFLGICLGLQVLFESSEEDPGVAGLGIMEGKVERIRARKVPHMGWNSLELLRQSRILEGIRPGDYFYFVHSYSAVAEKDLAAAICEYEGQSITAAVERDNVSACQFHPEKSGAMGLRILANFLKMCGGSS
jgi:glutamine amidotransferase